MEKKCLINPDSHIEKTIDFYVNDVATSETYYKDKKIAYKHYQKYVERFEKRDKIMTAFIKQCINEIKTAYFLEGEIVD